MIGGNNGYGKLDAHSLARQIQNRLDRFGAPVAVDPHDVERAGIPDAELADWARELGLECQPPLLPGAAYLFSRAR